ncbi:hypothetical protein [uncultured Ruminococcus sp.]|uniref:hypothetical protein n=1 Tax=uncultured Ruminococcus sp. TaxID=165186 RepID=UPI0025D6FF0D|nr:hypothetical protein [uncultured Ruminococcus sp.]
MIKQLKEIREPKENTSTKAKVLISISIALSGFLLGIFQKYIDGGVEMPQIFQALDIVNYFGRFAVWMLLGTIISVYAGTPIRASVNTFLFFISMVTAYYLYSNFVSGFLPTSYMMIWIGLSFASPLIAYICWYAKGKGIAAIAISAVILGVIFSQAFLITQGFYVTHILEVLTWIGELIVLRRKPKEFAIEVGGSLIVAIIYQLFIPYWG